MAEVYTPLTLETPHQQVDRTIAEMTVIADRREKMLRLLRNRDFEELFMRFYVVEEAARLAQMGGMLGISEQDQNAAMEMAKATGHFKRFIDVTLRQGEQAYAQLSNYRAEYDQLVLNDEGEAA
jgi:hypothetical protein